MKAHEKGWYAEMQKKQEERDQLIARLKLLRVKAILREDELSVLHFDDMLAEMGIKVKR